METWFSVIIEIYSELWKVHSFSHLTKGELLKGCLETIDCYDIICKIGLWQYQKYYTPCTKAPLPPRFWDPSLRPPKPIGKPDTGDRRYAVERHFQQYYFCYIVAVSFIGGGNRRRPSICRKSLTTDDRYWLHTYVVVNPTYGTYIQILNQWHITRRI